VPTAAIPMTTAAATVFAVSDNSVIAPERGWSNP
jgi:hypothetical protein